MVVNTEAIVLDTIDLGTKSVDAWVSGRLVRAVGLSNIPCERKGTKR